MKRRKAMLKIVQDIIAAQGAATKPISMLKEVEYPELDALMERFAELPKGEDHIEVITASNHSVAKAAFIEAFHSGKSPVSPTFEYNESLLKKVVSGRDAIAHVLDAILELPAETDEQALLKHLFQTVVQDKLRTSGIAQGILSHNDSYTLHHIEQKYGRLTDDVADAARNEYEELKAGKKASTNSRTFTPEEEAALKALRFDAPGLADIFKRTFYEYGPDFSHWTATIYDDVTAVNVREHKTDVAIPPTREADGIVGFGLDGHEIEAHVRHFMNGLRLLRIPFRDEDETLYEGLAKLNDVRWRQKFGSTAGNPHPYYILAAEQAMMSKNFSEIYAEIFQLRVDAGASTKDKKNGDPAPVFNNSWTSAYRAMRGSTSPVNEIGFANPLAKSYLEGYLMVKELVEAGYEHLVEVGIVRPSSLLKIANYLVLPTDIPYPNLGIAEKLAREAIGVQLEEKQV
jgi:hypothetical protein